MADRSTGPVQPPVIDLTATEALAAIRAGRLTATDYRDACLDRIAEREGTIRAFAWFDEAAVRRATRWATAPPAPGRCWRCCCCSACRWQQA